MSTEWLNRVGYSRTWSPRSYCVPSIDNYPKRGPVLGGSRDGDNQEIIIHGKL